MRIPNTDGGGLIAEIAEVIVANKAYLSEIDGLIGDGDHGVNMAKGFSRAAERTRPPSGTSEARTRGAPSPEWFGWPQKRSRGRDAS